MSKLDPKPNSEFELKDWDYLNKYLQYWFTRNTENPNCSVKYTEYNMSKEEIILEAEKKGYKTQLDEKNGYIVFS